jgi:glycosyltransferase involved in cell wall biosynthesis
LADCLRSVAQQVPASYTFDVTLIDDQSTDGTFEELARTTILPHAKLIRITENTGPAHARHIGISAIKDPNAVVVLLDMDDALEPHALSVVAKCYRDNPDCLLTIGNWHDQNGKINPQCFYTAEEIDSQRIREVELFNASPLRTFRRHLYDAVEISDLLDQQGKWLETCTDVALMYPLIDQCRSNEVMYIHEPIYRYTRKHSGGTLARFGKAHKVERLKWLKSKTPKARG